MGKPNSKGELLNTIAIEREKLNNELAKLNQDQILFRAVRRRIYAWRRFREILHLCAGE